jgi:protein O-GlcNAc transferase
MRTSRWSLLLVMLVLLAVPERAAAQSVDELFEQGNAAQSAGRFSEAESIWLRVVRSDPENSFAYNNLGNALADQEKMEEAIAAYRQAIQLDSRNAFPYNGLGTVLKAQGKLDEAIAAYRQAIQIDPKYAAPYYGLGVALYDQGKLDEAIAAYQQAIQIDPKFAVHYYGLGAVLSDQGKLDEAIAAYRQAIQIDPKYAFPYYGLGVALYDQGKLDEAIAAYQQAIQINPKFAFPYNGLGNALKNRGKLDEAIAAYRQAIQIDPKYAFPYNGLGNALSDQGKLDEAIAAYQQAIQLDPKYASPHNNLGNALYDQGKLDEAIASYRQALSLPDLKGTPTTHTVAHNNLGYALQQQGNLTEAIAEYQKAIALDPNYARVSNNLREAQRLLALQRNPQPAIADDQKYLPSITDEPLVPVLRSTARIIVETSGGTTLGSKVGTGWVVKREGNTVWVVTNRHVILSNDDTQQVSNAIAVEFYSQLPAEKRPRYTATVEKIGAPEDLDLAVIKITGIPADIQPLQPSPKRISLNTRVRVIGHPYTDPIPWHSSSGEISNYAPDPNNPWLSIDASVAEGNSGGPVVNDDSQIVAMMVTMVGAGDIATNPNEPSPSLQGIATATRGLGRAYRIDVVMEKLRSWRIVN